jgi:peptide/nickel transport system substrate-binding protein
MTRSTLVLLWLGLMVLAACKTDPGANADSVPYKRTSDTVIVRMEAEPDRLTPMLTISSYANRVNQQAFFTLENVDGKTLEYESLLLNGEPKITEIEEGEYAGGVAFDLEIHPEAVWDNGTPVTGNDYAFSLKTIFNPLVGGSASIYRIYFSNIKEVEVDPENPKQFRVVFYPKNIQARDIVTGEVRLLPEYHYDPDGLMANFTLKDLLDPSNQDQLKENADILAFADFLNAPTTSTDPVNISGCGPYEIKEWVAGERIILQKKADWWGDPLTESYPQLRAFPNAIVYTFIPNPTTALQALRAEEIDALRAIDPQEFVSIKDDPSLTELYNFHSPPSMSYYFVSVNSNNPKLADKKVRQALAHAIDVQEIIDNLYAGMGDRIVSPVYRDLDYYNDQLEPVPFDLEKAGTLLAEAGWEDSNDNGTVDKMINGELTELSLEYNYVASSDVSQNIALLIQDNAQKVGIDIQPNGLEARMTIQKLRTKDYEVGSAASTVAAIWNPKQSWHTEGDNRTGFGNAETDALIDEIIVTFDEEARRKMYMKLQETIYDESVQIFLFAPQERIAIHKRFDTETMISIPGFNPRFFELIE